MRKSGNSNRTNYNKHESVFCFLRWLGLNTKTLAREAPKFTEKEVEIFEPGELDALFSSLSDPTTASSFRCCL